MAFTFWTELTVNWIAAGPGLSGVMANDCETSAASMNPVNEAAGKTSRTMTMHVFVIA